MSKLVPFILEKKTHIFQPSLPLPFLVPPPPPLPSHLATRPFFSPLLSPPPPPPHTHLATTSLVAAFQLSGICTFSPWPVGSTRPFFLHAKA